MATKKRLKAPLQKNDFVLSENESEERQARGLKYSSMFRLRTFNQPCSSSMHSKMFFQC